MTLIVAAKGKEQIIIGADSRAVRQDAAGTRILTDSHEKLIKLNKFNYLLIAGDAERAIYLIENFKNQVKENDDVTNIVLKFKLYCRKEFEDLTKYMRVESVRFPEIVFVIAGYENDKRKKPYKSRIFTLRSMNMFQPGEKVDYIAEGKDTITQYLFAKRYRTEMNPDQLTKLVYECFYDTEKIDGEAGGNIHLATLDNKFGLSEIDVKDLRDEIENKEINDIINPN